MIKSKSWLVKTFIFFVMMIFASAGIVNGADIWSEPQYTEQWSTDLWSTTPYTERWSEEPDVPQSPQLPQQPIQPNPPSQPTTGTQQPNATSEQETMYILLQLDSKRAVLGNKEIMLDVAPTSIDGRTMVPFRFLAEVLQTDIDWDAQLQRITLTTPEKTIVLQVNHSVAWINGKEISLDAPPAIIDGRTLVPLRFIIESLDLNVAYTASSKTIEISNTEIQTGSGEAPTPNHADVRDEPSSTPSSNNDPLTDFEQLYGDWLIWTPGGATNLYYKDTGNYATHEYTPGAEQGTITIHANGTYSMKYNIWGDAEGEWRLSYPAEINGERIQAIVLLNGSSGYDWAVAPSENGKIRLLYLWGTWADGSSSWFFDSELARK